MTLMLLALLYDPAQSQVVLHRLNPVGTNDQSGRQQLTRGIRVAVLDVVAAAVEAEQTKMVDI